MINLSGIENMEYWLDDALKAVSDLSKEEVEYICDQVKIQTTDINMFEKLLYKCGESYGYTEEVNDLMDTEGIDEHYIKQVTKEIIEIANKIQNEEIAV